jgi:hypothetical protein
MKKRDFLRLIRDDVATQVEDSMRGLNWTQILAPHFQKFEEEALGFDFLAEEKKYAERFGQELAEKTKMLEVREVENASLRAHRAVLIDVLKTHGFEVKQNHDGTVQEVTAPKGKKND